MDYDIVPTFGHYEIYINGEFYCSTDTYYEAVREIEDHQELMCIAQ